MTKEYNIKSNIYSWYISPTITLTNKTNLYDIVIDKFKSNRTSI